jgi:hypothetical protein
VLALVLAALLGSRGVVAGAPAGSRPVTAHGHLYVLDVGTLSVFRFPLGAEGLPAAKPDNVLRLEGAKYPLGLAVNRAGNVFVADGQLGVVNEYAAGASGPQKPISTLNIPGAAPDHLKIDDAERLYVHLGGGDQNEAIAVYAKGAQGNDGPLSVIVPYYSPELAADYVITPSGKLYVLDWSHGAGILGYEHPLESPSKPDELLSVQGPWETSVGYSLALDDATGHLYFQFDYRYEEKWDNVNFADRAITETGGGISTGGDPSIFSSECPAQYGQTGGAVIVKRYLMVSCVFNPEVLVYRKDRFGKRSPVEIVGRGALAGPSQIAIGP